jgi:hypothetical protein
LQPSYWEKEAEALSPLNWYCSVVTASAGAVKLSKVKEATIAVFMLFLN